MPGPSLESVRLTLADGAGATLRVARFDRDRFRTQVVALDPCAALLRWCAETGTDHALALSPAPGGPPLGELRIDGRALPSEPFDAPWGERRGCVHADGRVALA